MGEITYEDIKRLFSEDDLLKYDLLCTEFCVLTGDKNNIELWNMVQYPSTLRGVLDEIHVLREKYDFLKGSVFFKVWTLDPDKLYQEICW